MYANMQSGNRRVPGCRCSKTRRSSAGLILHLETCPKCIQACVIGNGLDLKAGTCYSAHIEREGVRRYVQQEFFGPVSGTVDPEDLYGEQT